MKIHLNIAKLFKKKYPLVVMWYTYLLGGRTKAHLIGWRDKEEYILLNKNIRIRKYL